MASLSIPYADFVAGTTIASQQVDDNNAAIVNYINARNGASANWDAVSTIGAFTSTLTTNQIILGTTRTVTLTAPTPASASRTHTLPDVGGDSSFIMTLGAQTITGAKTYASSTLLLQEAGSTDVVTVAVATLAAGRTYTVPDAGADASFVLTNGAQTISGVKTFDGQLIGKGTATNDAAAAGYIGQAVVSRVSSNTNFAATGNWKDMTSISLTAGDWDVSGLVEVVWIANTINQIAAAISVNSGATTTDHVTGDNQGGGLAPNSNTDISIAIPNYRLSLSGTTTVYFKVYGSFTSTAPQYTCRISARRVR